MSKRRTSIRGRGAEILFGAPVAVEIAPRSSDLAVAEAEWLPSEPLVDTAPDSVPPAVPGAAPGGVPDADGSPSAPPSPDLDDLFLEEVQAAENGSEGDGDPPAAEEDLALTPEMEAALMEEAVAAQEPAEAVAGAPIQEVEAIAGEQGGAEAAVVYETPPPTAGDDGSGVLPPRPSRMIPDAGHAEAGAPADIQAPEQRVERLELPDLPMSQQERAELLAKLGDSRFQDLDQEIDEMYDQVLSKVGENDEIATECYNQLLRARDIVLRYEVGKLSQAEYYIEQVRARLKRADESRSGARKYAWLIATWGALWFAVFIALLILLNLSWFQDLIMPPTSGEMSLNMEMFLSAMVWGGIGAVVAVFYSLFKHVGRRDFDIQYGFSYLGKPFLGIILGATVYMLVHVTILALGILPAGLLGGGEPSTPVMLPWLVYLLAWAGGFKEDQIFDLIDRAIKQVFGGSE